MDILNSLISGIFNIVFQPFKNIDPVWGMLVVSFLTGIIMLFIFKATSDQKGIKRAKNLVKGHFLAIRLYKDDISLMFNTMSNILASNFLYMKKSMRPMLFLLVPVAFVLIQIGVRYEFRPLNVGETAVVSLQAEGGNVRLSEVILDLPQGLKLDMPPVRIDRLHEISWRILAEKAGDYEISFKYGNQAVKKSLVVVESLVPVTAAIARDDIGTTIMNPSESSISDASFASLISVVYPEREFEAFGFSVHWLVAFFVFSLVAAFGFKGFLGVEV